MGRYELTLFPKPGGVALSWDHFDDLDQAKAAACTQPECDWVITDHDNHNAIVAQSPSPPDRGATRPPGSIDLG